MIHSPSVGVYLQPGDYLRASRLPSLWEGFRESRRCSRDTYPESYITENILIYEENGRAVPRAAIKLDVLDGNGAVVARVKGRELPLQRLSPALLDLLAAGGKVLL